MESRDHSNGVSPKNRRSRGNIATVITYAQDIIITTKSEKITAKVMEVDVDVQV